MPEYTLAEKYERALWELTRAQDEVRECGRLMAVEYAAAECADARYANEETDT